MRPKNPTFLTTFASTIQMRTDTIVGQDNYLSLSYHKSYFFDKTLKIELKSIETFALTDDCPLLYLLDKEGHIHTYDIYRRILEKNIFHVEIDSPVDMVLYKNILYLLDKKMLRAFSLITWQHLWSVNIDKAMAMSVDKEGKLYIATSSNNTILKLNMAGKIIKNIIINDIKSPIAIKIDKGKLYIAEKSTLSLYDEKSQSKIILPTNIKNISSIAINSQESLFLGSSMKNINGTLWWGDAQKGIHHQLSTYSNTIRKIVFESHDKMILLDTEGLLSLVSAQQVYKSSGEIAHLFDSTKSGCDWHKIRVDYEIPHQKGSIIIAVDAFDYLPKYNNKIEKLPELSNTFTNKKNIYLHNVQGRYLIVKIKLQSDPQRESSPLFRQIKVHFPKETYLQYLPSYYQEASQSKELLQRYLSIFQTILEGIEEKIEKSHLLIDPQTTPNSEFLNWLSLWLGLNREENWSDEKWRELLSKAVYFFKRRGTREGLSELIELYTQISDEKKKPIIIEPFQTRCNEEGKTFNLDNYTFCVLVQPNTLKSNKELDAIKRIVKLWKPAHTEGKVLVLKEKMVLGSSLFLEINTALNEEAFILGEASLSIDSKLADIEESSQIESHARLGIDTQIKY